MRRTEAQSGNIYQQSYEAAKKAGFTGTMAEWMGQQFPAEHQSDDMSEHEMYKPYARKS